jgi:serine protease inhibitor
MQEECLSKEIRMIDNQSESNATLTRRSANQDEKALTALFAGQMQFSLNFFKKVFNASQSGVQSNKGTSENLFFSPMSIYSALLLAYFGANNRTEDQLTDVLGFQNMDKVGNQGFFLVFSST